MKILPGVFPVVGKTRQEADDKFEQLQVLLEPSVGLDMLADLAGVDEVRSLPVDALISELPETEGGKSRRAYLLLICTGACVPYSSRAAVPIDTQHCCVVLKYATTGIDHGLC